jgi:hypothetical protein
MKPTLVPSGTTLEKPTCADSTQVKPSADSAQGNSLCSNEHNLTLLPNESKVNSSKNSFVQHGTNLISEVERRRFQSEYSFGADLLSLQLNRIAKERKVKGVNK